MFALLILPILVSGFIVLSINPNEKLKLHRYDGQLLYLKAAKIGLRYFFVVAILSLVMKDTTFHLDLLSSDFGIKAEPPYELNISIDPSLVSHIAKQIARAKNNSIIDGTTLELSWLLSLSFLTVFCAYLISLMQSFWVAFKNKMAKELYNNDAQTIAMLGKILKDSPIDYIFYESFTKRKPILITLKNRKVYIGFVNKLGEPSESEEPNQEISIVPAISGYRDKDTLQVILQNDYNIPESFDSSQVIKVDQIDTVSWFTQEIYQDVNGNIGASPSTSNVEGSQEADSCEECKAKTKIKVGPYSLVKG